LDALKAAIHGEWQRCSAYGSLLKKFMYALWLHECAALTGKLNIGSRSFGHTFPGKHLPDEEDCCRDWKFAMTWSFFRVLGEQARSRS
jgi:hypothetical protein